MTHVSLVKIQHLLPENVIVGTNDVVPGVVDKLSPESPISECSVLRLFSSASYNSTLYWPGNPDFCDLLKLC